MLSADDIISNFKSQQATYIYQLQKQSYTLHVISNKLVLINLFLDNVISNMSQSKQIINHIHDIHLHNRNHSYNENDIYFNNTDVPITKGSRTNDLNTLYVTLLWLEYLKNIDLDENGLIFNKHFIIDSTDLFRPIGIQYYEIYDCYNYSLPTYTWQQYLNTLPNTYNK